VNLEIKQKFVNNCNVTAGDDFLGGCIEYVKEIDCKDDLDDFVKIITGMYQYKVYKKQSYWLNFADY